MKSLNMKSLTHTFIEYIVELHIEFGKKNPVY